MGDEFSFAGPQRVPSGSPKKKRAGPALADRELGPRKGRGGINYIFVDRGTFWALPLTCFLLYLPKIVSACLFPQPATIHYFCSGPISIDLICPQPRPADARGGQAHEAEGGQEVRRGGRRLITSQC